MAQELNVDVSEVVEGGTSLAFVAYPTAVTKVLNCPLSHAKVKQRTIEYVLKSFQTEL